MNEPMKPPLDENAADLGPSRGAYGKEALSKAGGAVRAGFRDLRAIVWQGADHPGGVPLQPQDLLTADCALAVPWRCGPVSCGPLKNDRCCIKRRPHQFRYESIERSSPPC